MKKLAMVMGLLAMSAGAANAPTVRFYVSGSTVPSGLILQGLEKHCQNAVLTLDDTKADYMLRAEYGDDVPNPSTFLVLYSKAGDSIFETETKHAENAVKDACTFLKINR